MSTSYQSTRPVVVDSELPAQSETTNGKALISNGLTANWNTILGMIGTNPGQVPPHQFINTVLPSQSGNNGLVLTTDGANASWEAVTLPVYPITPVATASYNVSVSDAGTILSVDQSSPVTITIPATITTVGTVIDVIQVGTGQITVTGDVGVTVNGAAGLKTRVRYSGISLICVSTNNWVVVGDAAV